MATRLSDICESVKTGEFPYMVNPDNIIFNDSHTIKVLITPDVLEETERYRMAEFLAVFGIEDDSIVNYGIATYDGSTDSFKGHSPSYVGLTEEGDIVLKIGITQGTSKASATIIPIHKEEAEIKRGKKTIKSWVYTIGDNTLDLEALMDNQGNIIANFLVMETEDGTKYSFPMLVEKSSGYAASDIQALFKSGDLDKCLRRLDSKRVYLAANKAFEQAFRLKTFPKDGVLLLVRNGRIKTTLAGTHEAIKNDIVEAQWDILATSHPELLVGFRTKTDGVAQFEFCSLSEASVISFSSAKNNNEGFNWLQGKNGSYQGIALIHIVSPAMNIKHSPKNTCTNLPMLISKKTAKYPTLAQKAMLELPSEVGTEMKASDFVRNSSETIGKIKTGGNNFKTVAEETADSELQDFLGDYGDSSDEALIPQTGVINNSKIVDAEGNTIDVDATPY